MIHHLPVPRVYSYTRFSTPEQEKGDSYRRQTDAARAYAEKHGLQLDESLSIVDLGVSAFAGANLAPEAGLGRFMEAISAGLVEPGSVLLIESLDRLSRATPRKAVRLLEDIIEDGVTVVTLMDGQRWDKERLDSDPMAFMLAYMIAMRANEESRTKALRVAKAWAEKRRKVRAGETKRLTKRAPAWLRPDGDGWAVDEDRAAIVRRVYRLTLDGMGEHKIAATLNKEGVPPLGRATMWHRSSVAKLLRNPAVIGTLVPGRIEREAGKKLRIKEEPIAGAFPAIISDADRAAVRSLKDGHAPANRGQGADAPLSNVLAGLARCPICDSAMTRVSKGGRKKAGKPKLVCTKAKGGAGCVYHSVPVDEVQEAVLSKPAFIVDSIPAGERSGLLDDLAENLRGSIDGTVAHLSDLEDATEGRTKPRHVAERIAHLSAELDTLQAHLDAVEEQRRIVDGGLVRERAYALANAISDREADGPLEPINAAMRVLFDGVTVDYPNHQLVFHWRQGGTTVMPYGSPFEDETKG
jgi:DNA invertase Pin-like site-specific DNA recombinase